MISMDSAADAVHYASVDERDIWFKISNSSAAIARSHSLSPQKIRSFSAIAVIRRLSVARHAARLRKMSNWEAPDTRAAQLRVQA